MTRLLLVAALALACAGPEPAPLDPAAAGGLSGSVTLLGSEELPGSVAVRVSLFTSQADYEVRRSAIDLPLIREPGTRRFTFSAPGLPPGDYLLIACFSFGCGDYRDRATGALIPVRVVRGRGTVIEFVL